MEFCRVLISGQETAARSYGEVRDWLCRCSDGLENVAGRDALKVRRVGPDLLLELAEEGSSLLHRLEPEVDSYEIRVVDPVTDLDRFDTALGPKVVEGSEGLEPWLQVVDAVFDVK